MAFEPSTNYEKEMSAYPEVSYGDSGVVMFGETSNEAAFEEKEGGIPGGGGWEEGEWKEGEWKEGEGGISGGEKEEGGWKEAILRFYQDSSRLKLCLLSIMIFAILVLFLSISIIAIKSATACHVTEMKTRSHTTTNHLDSKQLPRSAVVNHAQYFQNEGGLLKYDCMNQIQANIESCGYFKSLFASDAILRLLDLHDKEYTGEAVASITNPAATGLWKEDGEVDEELFAVLAMNFSVQQGDVVYVTQDGMMRFLEWVHEDDTSAEKKEINSDSTSARILQISIPNPRLGISWEQITEASISRLFEDFSDQSDLKIDSKNQGRAMTIENLHLFYADSPTFFRSHEKLQKGHIGPCLRQ